MTARTATLRRRRLATQFCPEHGQEPAFCSVHGCSWCETEDQGRGECGQCDTLTRAEYPDPDCKNGDDCLTCAHCRRCMCKRPICRECGRCADHAEFEQPGEAEPLACDHSWWDPIRGTWT